MTPHHIAGRVVVTRDAPRTDWLAGRRLHICASDWAKILGLAPRSWGGEYSVWAEKTETVPGEDFSYRMLIGQLVEDTVIKIWQATTLAADVGTITMKRSGLIESRTRPLFAATPDRRSRCPRGRCSVEVKKTGDRKLWGTPEEPLVPLHYIFQGQGQILSDGLDHVHYLAMDDNWWVMHRVVQRDDGLIERACTTLESWWEKHVVAGEPPVVTGADHDTLVQQFAGPLAPRSVLLDPEHQDLLLRLHRVKARGKRWKDEAADLQAQLQMYLGQRQATEALWPDETVAYSWNISEAVVDGADKDWQLAEPALADRFMRNFVVRRLDTQALLHAYPKELPARLRRRRTFDIKPLKGPNR
jgi:predicted phage-related endonuclease